MLLQRLDASTSLRKIAVTMLLEGEADGSVVTEAFLLPLTSAAAPAIVFQGGTCSLLPAEEL